MNARWRVLLLAAGWLAATPLAAQGLDDIGGFFARWQELEQEHHPAVANFYADDAVIRIKRLFPDGSTQQLNWTGVQYKTYLALVFPEDAGRDAADQHRSLYSDIDIDRIAGGYRISGTRYWTGDCSTDPEWYIVVQRDRDGVLTIIEENAIETMQSLCEPDNAFSR